MDPFRLRKYAGHADMKTTMRYVHPKDETMEEAMERDRTAREVRLARGGHTSGHTTQREPQVESAGIRDKQLKKLE
jgi:hypothetical protein